MYTAKRKNFMKDILLVKQCWKQLMAERSTKDDTGSSTSYHEGDWRYFQIGSTRTYRLLVCSNKGGGEKALVRGAGATEKRRG